MGTHFKQNYIIFPYIPSLLCNTRVGFSNSKEIGVRCGLGTKSIGASRVLTLILNVHMEDK